MAEQKKMRGSLRVLLGAAPGVGKTVAMLREGHRLQEEGKDVVIALLETHGRKATQAAAEGLEQVPRQVIRYRGMRLEEMDMFAIIERNPQIALVDELAHTNAPGSMHEKRWQDVEDLLDAGIDVITTINVQHIESLNDVVREITGSEQKETVPDRVLRAANQVELVDLPPQTLRDRLSAGLVYQADRVDAALSNYFRVGNLTSLRELALLWLAGNVDDALKEYRDEHHISAKWEVRERVIVALSGGPEGDQLLRRGARVARASGGGDLMAVHVTSEDGLRSANPKLLNDQRELVEKLGGSYHQIVGEDIADALLQFARANNATQIIVGVSRRSALKRWFGRPSSTNGIVEKSGDIDVHIVTHSFAAKRLELPRLRRTMTLPRIVAGCAFAVASVLGMSLLLLSYSGPMYAQRDALIFQLAVVASALIGGMAPATIASILSGLALDFLYIQPVGTFHIPRLSDLVTVVLYVAVGIVVSLVVDRADERARLARRASAESEMLASISGAVLRSNEPLQEVIDRTREAFGFVCVRVIQCGADAQNATTAASSAGSAAPITVLAQSGELPIPEDRTTADDPVAVTVTKGITLELYGHTLEAADQRLLMAIVSQIQTVLEHIELQKRASEVEPLAAADKIRSALLNAVSHDLRRPLASATAAISGLQRMGSTMSADDRRELLGLANSSLQQLTKLVTDLLDVSRLREGALPLSLVACDVGEAIVPVLDELHIGPSKVDLDLDLDMPLVIADPPLLRRAMANVLINAMRFNPEGARVRIATSAFADRVEIRIADHGAGVPDDRKADIFVPFHRLGDTDNTTGLGLGMALSKGFVESMGGTIDAEDTPGGGLTMVISLRVADSSLAIGQPIPKNQIPSPTEGIGEMTMQFSGAVSDLILPVGSHVSQDVRAQHVHKNAGQPTAEGGAGAESRTEPRTVQSSKEA